jgi:cytochrome d ubiquinol oxidase subunit II
MATTWFVILAAMLTVYVVLDGFDLGAGVLHLFVAESDRERRTVLGAIGPVWDGNEVWLIASGGVLVFAFPRVYAAGFSGFYLPLMMALWLLIGRGVAIELRSHHENPLWRSFWDAIFALSSTVFTFVLGVAFGNVVRGVPLGPEGYFGAPLFTNFLTSGAALGAIDWYTALVGLFALVALAAHGALYLRMKTTGEVQARSAALAGRLWVAVMALAVLVTVATAAVRPELFAALVRRPLAWPLALAVPAALGVTFVATRRGREVLAFAGSVTLLASMLAMAAVGLFPVILRSTVDPALSLDVINGSIGAGGLALGLAWWLPAMALAVGYHVYVYRQFRGKVSPSEEGHHY